jgi:hypothetical protein
LEKLRLNHLNPEEKEIITRICRDYLPGDKRSCTNAVKHSISVILARVP